MIHLIIHAFSSAARWFLLFFSLAVIVLGSHMTKLSWRKILDLNLTSKYTVWIGVAWGLMLVISGVAFFTNVLVVADALIKASR